MQLFKHLTANNIKLTPLEFKRELSMEAYIIENSEILILDNDNLSDVEIIEDELTIKSGRSSKNTDGRIDLLALYNENTYGIIELKLGEINNTHLDQLTDYIKEKDQILKIISDSNDQNITDEIKWIGILVGTSINSELQSKINSGYLIEDSIPIAALVINRYRGVDNQIYVLTESYFNNISRNFDKTQYKFSGELYGKGRLVLAIIKKYIEDHENVTYSELKTIFPKNIQGSYGVISTLEDAEKIYSRTKKKRHFIKPGEIINLDDNTKIAVSTQWGKGNIDNIIKKAKELNYAVEKIAI